MKNSANILLFLCLTIAIRADIPPPPVGESIRIQLNQTTKTEYEFYLCTFDLEVKPNPNPPHPSRPNMIVEKPDSFQMKKIELSNGKNYDEPLGNSRIQYRGTLYGKAIYLAAIEKSKIAELESKLKESIIGKKQDEIRFILLEDSYESRGSDSKGAKVVVNKILLDEKGMTKTVEEGSALVGNSKSNNCIGLGLLFTGLALIGGWWSKKRFV